jgi:hypothetical protein
MRTKAVALPLLLALLLIAALTSVVAAQTEAPTLHVRVAHFSPDTPAVDIFLNGTRTPIQGLAFGSISDWVEIPAGSYQVAAITAERQRVIGPATFDLPADAWITVAAVGSLKRGTLQAAPVIEDYSPLEAGQARVTVFHGIEGVVPVDVLAGDSKIVDLLAFPGKLGGNDGAASLTVPAGIYDLQVVPAGETLRVLFDLKRTILVANTSYFIAAIGPADAPQVVIKATSLAQ